MKTILEVNFTVLFENDIENGMMHGFTENYIRVGAQYDPHIDQRTQTSKANEHQ
jgi:hypothetical protein